MIRIPAAALLAAAAASAAGAECTLPRMDRPAFTGDTVTFTLTCPAGGGQMVSWEFGDGTPLADSAASLLGRHAYGSPGLYTVFARIRGEDIPASTSLMVVHRPTPARPARSSTILYDSARARVWAVNPDHHSVSALDVRTRTRLFEVPVGRNPRTLALGPDGHIWVACQEDASITLLDGASGRRLATLALPFASRPYGIAFDPAGRNAYVTLEALGRLLRLDPATRAVTGDLALGPTPRALAVSHDGVRILVTRHLSRMTVPGAADFAEVWEVDGPSFALKRTFRLEADTAADRKDNGRGIPNNLSAITISPDGRTAFVPCTKANTQKGLALDRTKPSFENSVRTVVASLDLVANREDMATRKDVDNRAMASSFTLDRLGRFGYLTLHGDNRTNMLLGHGLKEFSTLPLPDNPPEVILKGEAREAAPIGSVLDAGDSLLFVHYYLSREVGVYDVSRAGTGDPLARLALIKTVAKEVLPLPVLVGKQIFHNAADTRMSKEGYINCAVCHIDGATDGRVWDFTDRGEGLRRTTNLLGRGGLAHGPVHWSANFDEIQDFEHDMRGPFAGTGFLPDGDFAQGTRSRPLGDRKAGLSPELDALAAYVSSLTTVRPSPYRDAQGAMTAEARLGKAVFHREDVGCARCHVPPLYTDSRLPLPGAPVSPGPVAVFPGAKSRITAEGFLLHDVGTLKATSGKRLNDTLPGLDTPTLKGAWEGGPYLHDGSAATLLDVIAAGNPADRHGKTSHLTEAERKRLLAFLMQLDDLDEAGNVSVRKAAGEARTGRGALVLRSGEALILRRGRALDLRGRERR